MRVFLDNAATTPLDPEVAKAMYEVMTKVHGNPSSIHKEGREARTLIEKARKQVANFMGVSPGEIFFTSGGTEADNMAIKCMVQSHKIDLIISTEIEHHAVTHTIEECVHKYGTESINLKLDELGRFELSELEKHLANAQHNGKKTLVSLMHSNNEIGNMIDISKVGHLIKSYGAYFHSDMVQTIGHYNINLKDCKVDFTAASAHKFNGPKGIGFIYINNEIKIDPYMTGGAQERNMRGGTENIYGIIGLAKALEIAIAEMEIQQNHIKSLKNYFKSQILTHFEDVRFNGDIDGLSSFTVLNTSFKPFDKADMLLFNLDIEGISVSGGSACSSGSDIGSHVLAQIPNAQGRANVRFSFGKQNTLKELDYVIGKLVELLK